MFRPAHIHISTYLVKRAADAVAPNSPEMDPRILAALLGGGVGAVGGGMVQLVRKLLQSRRDEEENGAPSIMRGILTGGLGGAALGAGAEHLARGAAAANEVRSPAEAQPRYSLAGASGFGGPPPTPAAGSLAELLAGSGAVLPQAQAPLRVSPSGPTLPGALEVPSETDQDQFLSTMIKRFRRGAPSPFAGAMGPTVPGPDPTPSLAL